MIHSWVAELGGGGEQVHQCLGGGVLLAVGNTETLILFRKNSIMTMPSLLYLYLVLKLPDDSVAAIPCLGCVKTLYREESQKTYPIPV